MPVRPCGASFSEVEGGMYRCRQQSQERLGIALPSASEYKERAPSASPLADLLPPRRGGRPSSQTVSAAGRPAGFARLPLARRGLVGSARALAAATLLVLTGALALPATAEAQTTLVSNIGHSTGHTLGGGAPWAQRFTAGSNPSGYTLTAVDVVNYNPVSATSTPFTARVCETNASGFPTSDCTALTVSVPYEAGTLSLPAPAVPRSRKGRPTRWCLDKRTIVSKTRSWMTS